MPRPLRLEYEGAFHHVMNRGRNRQTIFHDADYFEAFLTTLKEAIAVCWGKNLSRRLGWLTPTTNIQHPLNFIDSSTWEIQLDFIYPQPLSLGFLRHRQPTKTL